MSHTMKSCTQTDNHVISFSSEGNIFYIRVKFLLHSLVIIYSFRLYKVLGVDLTPFLYYHLSKTKNIVEMLKIKDCCNLDSHKDRIDYFSDIILQ